MGSIIARKDSTGATRYRAQIRIKQSGVVVHSESSTFSRKAAAQEWIAKREKELAEPGALAAVKHQGVTVSELVDRYLATIGDKFGRSKTAHLKQMKKMELLAGLSATQCTSVQLVQHADDRRKEAGPSTVANDFVWLRVLFRHARVAWGIPCNMQAIDDAVEALRAARTIGRPRSRRRRPTAEELEALDAFFRKKRWTIPMWYVMWLAIYSARRLSELFNIEAAHLHDASGTYMVYDLKHPDGAAGNDHEALLPEMGWVVLRDLQRTHPVESGPLLPWSPKTASNYFTRACFQLGIKDLHFHDLRHEGASRLAEDGKTIPEIQQVTLHEDWGSLKVYVNVRGRRGRRADYVSLSR